jgi:dihydroorotate dehydrogenase
MVFALDAEDAHDLTIAALKTAGALLPSARNESGPPVPAMGLAFPSRVGLAAGLDKNGECIEAWFRLGFGFVELGTVTPRPQPGNPRPRLFRLPEVQGIVNRMGFNKLGVDHLVAQVLAAREKGIRGIIGINIGKNFDTPIEKAADDYLACLERVHPHADYVTVNISSPNTKNLRQLQGESELDALLAALARRRESLADRHGRRTPLALKIAPDLESAQIVQIADALRRHRIDAVIATNTTLSREGVEQLRHGGEAGGLSGGPLFERSTAVLRELAAALAGEIPIVAAGGITDGGRALAKLEAGARLVQLYSGLIYRGPGLIGECVKATRSFR